MGTEIIVYNGAAPTTAAVVAVATGTTIKTMLQVKGALDLWVVEWGISFDAVATGKVELLETGTVFATVTAHAQADVMNYNSHSAIGNTSGTSGVPLNLGTTASGYTSTGEGTITSTRVFDPQQLISSAQYVKQFPLGDRPHYKAGNALRIRTHMSTGANAICYVVLEI